MFYQNQYVHRDEMREKPGGYEKEKARVLYDFRDRQEVPAFAPEEKAHIGF